MKNQLDSYTSKQLFEIASAKKEKEDAAFIKTKFFKCFNCDKSSRLDKWERVYDYWYEDCPYTPRWNSNEEMRIICPKCRYLNRIIQNSDYDYKEQKTIRHPHPLKTKIEQYINRGGKFTAEYSTYIDYYHTEVYKNSPDKHVWNDDKREKLKALPYIQVVNIPYNRKKL